MLINLCDVTYVEKLFLQHTYAIVDADGDDSNDHQRLLVVIGGLAIRRVTIAVLGGTAP